MAASRIPSPANEDFLVLRYEASGALDSMFGNGGIVSTPFGGNHERALSIAVQPDNKIVVGGVLIPAGGNASPSFVLPVGTHTVNGRLYNGFGHFTDTPPVIITVQPLAAPLPAVLHSTNTPVPGAGTAGSRFPVKSAWAKLGVPAINNAGRYTFYGEVATGLGIEGAVFLAGPGSGNLQPALLRYSLAPEAGSGGVPAGAIVSAIKAPVIAANGDLLVPVTLLGLGINATNDNALVWIPGNNFAGAKMVVRKGDPLADAGGTTVKTIHGASIGEGGVAFTATLATGSGIPGVTRGFNTVGQVIALVGFTNNTSAIVQVQIP